MAFHMCVVHLIMYAVAANVQVEFISDLTKH